MSDVRDDLNWAAADAAARSVVDPWNAENGPGGAIIVFDTDNFHIESCGGLESLATGAPFSPDSIVRYASITKHILATMVLRHADRIGLDDPLSRHLPELKKPMADVTVGRALDMTAGLPDVRESLSLLGVSVHTVTDAPALLDFLYRHGELNFTPGHEISYSNTGYRLVEAALQKKRLLFNDWLQKELSETLDISFYAPETWLDPVPGLVPGYWKSESGWQIGNAGLHLSASGSITGSARHLARWLQSVLVDEGPGRDVLKSLSVTRRLADGRSTRYGLGMAWSEIGSHRFIGHGGSHAGYKAYFLLDPKSRAGMVVVSNREDTATFGVAQKVMAALVGETLPIASTDIPEGLYIEDEGPCWLEMKNGVATFLGTGETLYPAEDGWSVSLSAHLPMRLRWVGGAVEGEIGHAARRFVPVEADDILSKINGRWVCPAEHAAFDIADGHLETGIGPARIRFKLTSLGKGRVLMEGRDGPWEKRASLVFEGNRVLIALNRSRVVEYWRDGR